MFNPAILAGEPGSVRLVDLPHPGRPTGRSVRIAMLRTPINPADLLAIDGRYAPPVDPALPLGAEGVGRVEAIGQDVGDLAPGALVLPLTRGNWCARRLIDRASLIVLPPGIDPGLAAGLRINPPTARLMLAATGVGAADVLVQNGAGSAVAAWVRLFARGMGVTVIDVVRRPDAGLTDALLDGPDLAERVKTVAAGRQIRAALDCVAGAATGRLAACLAPGGRLIVFGHLSGDPISVASQTLTGGGLSITGFSLRPAESALGDARVRALFADILRTVRDAVPELPVRATFPLDRVEDAIALARAGSGGRVQLCPTT